MADQKNFPVASFYFRVTIDKLNNVSFKEVSGLQQEAEQLEYRYGADKAFVSMKRAGMMKTGTITLKRGLIAGEKQITGFLKQLHEKNFGPAGEPIKTFTIELLDEKENSVVTWSVLDAVPLKIVAPELRSDNNEVAIESIEFAHRGITAEMSS